MNTPTKPFQASLPFSESYCLDHEVGCGRILFADDHALMRRMVAEGLTGRGYRVECAEDGEEAWDALCRDDFDLLITDHEMPRLTGLDLLRRIRSSPFRLPAILISGKIPTDAEGFEEILLPGAALAKPFSLEQLLALMGAVMLSSQGSYRFRA